MRFTKHSLASLLLLPLLLLAPGCGNPGQTRPVFPSAADLKPEPKPVPPLAILTDATAEALYNSAIEAWGERESAKVARTCRWAKALGMAIKCPEAR